MTFFHVFDEFLRARAGEPAFQFLAIVVGTLILEDATSILAALAAASGYVPATLALASLCIGIAVGDIGLYALGGLAATHPWAWRLVERSKRQRAQAWLADRLVLAVVSSRFIPGMRLPTYTACGFLRVSFLRFTAAVVGATLVWTLLVFSLVYRLGPIAGAALGVWRWPVGIAVALIPIVWTRRSQRSSA